MSGQAYHPDELAGKVALVTGGSRGIGLGICRGLAAAGATVLVSSRKAEACEAAAEGIVAAGGKAEPLPFHAGHWREIEGAVDTAYERHGRLDCVVNNAGIAPVADTLLDVDERLFDKTIEVDLKGPFRMMAVAGARMRAAGGGSIVNISSIGSVRPAPREAVYSAAKAGLNALTLALSQEYAPEVRVNCVMPGAFRTDMASGWDEDFVAMATSRLPAGRIGDPDEIAGLVVYLASDRSSYTTGAMIPVDGGQTAVY